MAYSSSHENQASSAAKLAELFRMHGWQVEEEPGHGYGSALRPDLVVESGALGYAVEVKAMGEGRPDRALALLSQALLQADRHAALLGMRPLAVVYVSNALPSLWNKLVQFRQDYAPNAAIGLVSDAGWRQFIGPGLEYMNVEPPDLSGKERVPKPRKASDLFSDLNQWMLKVLLAPELPEHLLNAPRGEYRSVSQLAYAAGLSTMSASRFINRLREEGFVEDSVRGLRLVRRRELFSRWKSAAMRPSPELRMSYLLPGKAEHQLKKVASALDGCVGIFSAADLLQLGHVSGVSPYVYVKRFSKSSESGWSSLVPCRPGEQPQLVVMQANYPESLYRGAVSVDGVQVSDVLQIWLDSAAHPSRGAEQAFHLEQGVLSSLLGASE